MLKRGLDLVVGEEQLRQESVGQGMLGSELERFLEVPARVASRLDSRCRLQRYESGDNVCRRAEGIEARRPLQPLLRLGDSPFPEQGQTHGLLDRREIGLLTFRPVRQTPAIGPATGL